ncbi:MAG TPA: hypothetical protein VIL05_12945 [Thermoclostridium sp.]
MIRRILALFIILTLIPGCGSFSTTENEKPDTVENLIHSISTNDGKSKAELYIDKNIKLRINNKEEVVSELFDNNTVNKLKQRYSLFEAGDGVIAVVYKDHTAIKEYMILDLFMSKDDGIHKIFSSRDIFAKIKNVDDDKIELCLPEYNANCTVSFTEEELGNWKQKRSELEDSNISIDDNFITEIQDNLILSPADYYVGDSGQSGNNSLYILMDVNTVGTMTPSIRDRAIIEFKLSKEGISYKNIIFERYPKNSDDPFAYFRKQTIN